MVPRGTAGEAAWWANCMHLTNQQHMHPWKVPNGAVLWPPGMYVYSPVVDLVCHSFTGALIGHRMEIESMALAGSNKCSAVAGTGTTRFTKQYC